jgi:hypothetical protein
MARVKVISPSGEAGDIPEEQLAAAMAQGYKRADAGPAEQPTPLPNRKRSNRRPATRTPMTC